MLLQRLHSCGSSRLNGSLLKNSLRARTFALAQHTNEEEGSGLSFKLSDQQLAVQELARKFAKEEMIPMEKHHDQSMEYPQKIFTKAWELGLLNSHIPEVRFVIYDDRSFDS